MILRLLLFEDCNRRCEGCCNKQFDLKALPQTWGDFESYEQILLTGGEPMLKPDVVIETAKRVPRGIPVYLYTAKVDDLQAMAEVLPYLNGLTLTLHEPKDLEMFYRFDGWLYGNNRVDSSFSLRLNVFKGIERVYGWCNWHVKPDIEWINPCPLPANEVFMRL